MLENDDNKIDKSPRSLPVLSHAGISEKMTLLTVLPAYDNTVEKPSKQVVSKHTLSWADIASNKRNKE